MIRRPPFGIQAAGWGLTFRSCPSSSHKNLQRKKGAVAPNLMFKRLHRLSKSGAASQGRVITMRRFSQFLGGDFLPFRNVKLAVKSPRMLNSTLNPFCSATARFMRTAYDSPGSTMRPAGVFTLCADENGCISAAPPTLPPLLRAGRSRR